MYFKFVNENKLNILEEQALVEAEIAGLVPSSMGSNAIKPTLWMTMIDRKITSHLSQTSTKTCDICIPSEMNNLEKVTKRPFSNEIYKYGLSTLHACIRCIECLLHIAYRLDFKKCQTRDAQSKQLLKSKKHCIQQRFLDEMRMLIDIVKQGARNTNDKARKLFSDPDKTEEITGLDSCLIHGFSIVLHVIACGERVNTEEFEKYVKLYGWFYMPASIHKLLLHGAQIIEHLNIMHIRQLSKEASKARNKDFEKIREHHTRKFCRKETNEDIFNGLLVSSDPYLSSIRPVLRKITKTAVTEDIKPLIFSDATVADKENLEFVNVNASVVDSDLEDLENEKDTLS